MISVIIPFYNHHKYINECLESIFNQTYKDFEIILIDDGSQPKLVLNNENIKLIRLEYNKGVASAKNEGIKYAKYNYIKIFGADDVAMPEMLERNLLALKEKKWSVGGCSYIDEKGNKQDREVIINDFNAIKDLNIHQLEGVGVFSCGFADGSCMYKKELFEKYGGFDERLRFGEDRILWAKLFRNKEYPQYIYEKLYYYRQGSTVTRKERDRSSDILLEKLLALRRNEY